MKSGYAGVLLSVVVAAVAWFERVDPFSPSVHAWGLALVVALAGVYLVVSGATTALGGGGSRGAALASLGGGLLAACLAFAAFVVGSPARVPVAPGQSYRPPRAQGVAVEFPAIPARGPWPDRVAIVDGPSRTF